MSGAETGSRLAASTTGLGPSLRFTCGGCGAVVTGDLPFACPNLGDGGDHVVAPLLRGPLAEPDDDPQPFVRWRRRLAAWHRTGDDRRHLGTVRRLDDAVADVAAEAHGVTVSPTRWWDGLGCWVKDETGQPGGSHKVRHLFGLALWLEAVGVEPARPLAIASCGNAALAAAIVARAAGRPLRVFVPPAADPWVLDRLGSLGADVTICARPQGVAGDPCYRRFRDAVAGGALPFSVQGPDCGLAVEGARTLAWELAEQCEGLDRVCVQVGGGALASGLVAGFRLTGRTPILNAVQTDLVHPLVRAWERAQAVGRVDPFRRADYMWPWDQGLSGPPGGDQGPSGPPGGDDGGAAQTSLAGGIVDDEAYDWLEVVRGMSATGGWPVTAAEDELSAANRAAVEVTGIAADETGTAGLAGLRTLRRTHDLAPAEHVAVIFTGARRPR